MKTGVDGTNERQRLASGSGVGSRRNEQRFEQARSLGLGKDRARRDGLFGDVATFGTAVSGRTPVLEVHPLPAAEAALSKVAETDRIEALPLAGRGHSGAADRLAIPPTRVRERLDQDRDAGRDERDGHIVTAHRRRGRRPSYHNPATRRR